MFWWSLSRRGIPCDGGLEARGKDTSKSWGWLVAGLCIPLRLIELERSIEAHSACSRALSCLTMHSLQVIHWCSIDPAKDWAGAGDSIEHKSNESIDAGTLYTTKFRVPSLYRRLSKQNEEKCSQRSHGTCTRMSREPAKPPSLLFFFFFWILSYFASMDQPTSSPPNVESKELLQSIF